MKPTIRPTPKQHKAWEALDPKEKDIIFVFFGGGRGGGKSWLGCEWLLTNCYFFPGSRWFIGRNELKRLMNTTFVTWQKVCKYHDIPHDDWSLNGQYNYIEFKNGSRIDLLDVSYKPSDPDYERFGSSEYTGGWGEEVGEWHFKAFDYLKGSVGRHKNREYSIPPKMLCTLNPTKDWPYRLVYKPRKEGKLPKEYIFIQSLYRDNPHTARDYEKMLSAIDSTATRQRLMFGNWEYDDSGDALMEYDNILDIFTNTIVLNREAYLTVDAARMGKDKIIYSFWRGWDLYRLETRTKQKLNKTGEQIRDLSSTEGVPRSHIIIDEDGVGAGIIDHLEGVKGFVANHTPFKQKNKSHENYKTLKDQCAWHLASKVNQHEVCISADIDEDIKQEIVADLEQIRDSDIYADAKKSLISKIEIREILSRSPDVGDTMIMRSWFDVSKANAEHGREARVFTPSYYQRDIDNLSPQRNVARTL